MKRLLKLISIMREHIHTIDIYNIFGYDEGEEIIKLLLDNEICSIDGELIRFEEHAKLKMASIALRSGIDIKEIAKVLTWKDFEKFASMILEEHRYTVYNSFRINRLEIDILAIDDLALVIDCKHWKYNSNSRLKDAINKQILRIDLLLKSNKFDIEYAIPLILTLYESIPFIDNVPIVPIDKFSSFINEFKGYLDSLLVIKA